MWYRRYRMLIGIYAIALAVGAREYFVSREQPPVDLLTDEWSEMTHVVSAINPNEPDTEFLEALQAMRSGDEQRFMQLMEEALASDVKHNELLLNAYAQQLVNQSADYRLVNLAMNRWRENHPFSSETISLPLGQGPRTLADSTALRDALAEVPWIAGWALESTTDATGGTGWVVLMSLHPARNVDMREAVAAATVLSLTPEQRSRYRVRCTTMVDCALEPR